MRNNVIRYMMDNDLLCLDSLQYNKDIPIEDDVELNDLEIKLRKEIGFIIGRCRGLKGPKAFESDFEDFIVKRMRRNIDLIFIPIGDTKLKDGQLFRWSYAGDFDTYYFPKWDGARDVGILREFWYCPDPEECYITNEDIINYKFSSPIKMKKHRSKKWKNGKKK